jgi:hypothetical protein
MEDQGIDGGENYNGVHQDVGCEGVDWIHLARDSVQSQAPVSAVLNFRIT